MNKTKILRSIWPFPWQAILSMGVIISALMFIMAYRLEKAGIEDRFNVIAKDRATVIINGILSDIKLLRTIQAFYESSANFKREEFRKFTSDVLKDHPEILELRWLRRVTAKERQSFEKNTAEEGVADFHIKDMDEKGDFNIAPQRDEYFPIYYVVPWDDSKSRLLGFDPFAVAERRRHMEKAIHSAGEAFIAKEDRIPDIAGLKTPARVFIPLYKNRKLPHKTTDENHDNIGGFAVILFDMNRLVNLLLRDMRGKGIDTYIYDLSLPQNERLICFDFSRTRGQAIKTVYDESQIQDLKGIAWKGVFDVADTKILVICRPAPMFLHKNTAYQSWIIFVACLIISLVVTLNVKNLSDRSAKIDAMVIEKTKELSLSQFKLKIIFDQSHQFMWIIDTDKALVDANRMALDFAGVKMADVLGSQFCETPWWAHSKDLQDKLGMAMESALEGRTVKFEDKCTAKDGVSAHLDFSIEPIKDIKGNIIWILVEGRDISEHVGQENALKDAYKKLKEIQSQLIEAEKMETVGRVASGVAHEIKNPLAVILQGINYFETALPAAQDHDRNILRMMKKNVRKADDIVSTIFSFSTAEELHIEPQDINEAIDRAANLIRYELAKNKIELIEDLGKNLPKIPIDKIKVEQVIVNLLNNAMDIMIDGGKLYVRSYLLPPAGPGWENDLIEKCWPGSKQGAVVVEVEDTGIGMDEDVKRRIFDAFFTTKGMAQGTGLGLAVSKRIIEMHGGHIFVDSEKGKGTKVTMVFKLSSGAGYKKDLSTK